MRYPANYLIIMIKGKPGKVKLQAYRHSAAVDAAP